MPSGLAVLGQREMTEPSRQLSGRELDMRARRETWARLLALEITCVHVCVVIEISRGA